MFSSPHLHLTSTRRRNMVSALLDVALLSFVGGGLLTSSTVSEPLLVVIMGPGNPSHFAGLVPKHGAARDGDRRPPRVNGPVDETKPNSIEVRVRSSRRTQHPQASSSPTPPARRPGRGCLSAPTPGCHEGSVARSRRDTACVSDRDNCQWVESGTRLLPCFIQGKKSTSSCCHHEQPQSA